MRNDRYTEQDAFCEQNAAKPAVDGSSKQQQAEIEDTGNRRKQKADGKGRRQRLMHSTERV